MRNPKALDGLAAFALFAAGAWLAHTKLVDAGSWSREGVVGQVRAHLYENQLAIYFILLLAAFVLKAGAEWLKRRRTKQAVYRLLDAMVVEVMRTPATFNTQDFRVTLFRHQQFSFRAFFTQCNARDLLSFWRLHYRGWLVPYARSGDDRAGGRTIFIAPLVAKQGQRNGHGICGTAWLLGECHIDGLPALHAASGEAQRLKYARRAHMNITEVANRLRTGRSLAASYAAERISTSFSSRWGVVVYDSVDQAPIIDAGNEKAHRLALQALSLVLEEYAS